MLVFQFVNFIVFLHEHVLAGSQPSVCERELTITKALTKTTNCTFRTNKVEGTSKKFRLRAGRVSPTFKFFWRHWCHLLWMAIQMEVEIHFSYKMHADCQTGGHAPRDTTGPLETLVKKLRVEFWLRVDSAYALYSCFHHFWYAFTSGSD